MPFWAVLLHLSCRPLQVLEGCNKVSPQPSLLQAEVYFCIKKGKKKNQRRRKPILKWKKFQITAVESANGPKSHFNVTSTPLKLCPLFQWASQVVRSSFLLLVCSGWALLLLVTTQMILLVSLRRLTHSMIHSSQYPCLYKGTKSRLLPFRGEIWEQTEVLIILILLNTLSF